VRDREIFAGGKEFVAVCGGGAAGMAAAISAARSGVNVCLVEVRPQLGGTVAHSLIHTLGGLYDSAGELLNGGLAEELTQVLARADASLHKRRMGRTWVLSVCPEVYQTAAQGWIESEPRITVLHQTRVTGTVMEGDAIRELALTDATGERRLRTKAVIDATGSAAVTRRVDESLVQGEEKRAVGGLIFQMRGAQRDAVAFPKGLGILRSLRDAVADGSLPKSCANVWLDAGARADEVYVKLPVPVPSDWHDRDEAELLRESLRTQASVVSFLRRMPEFANASVSRTGELGVRDGGRVFGEYLLTVDDVRRGARFADAACRCSWPVEYWDPGEGVSLEYLPVGSYYEIPLRSLKVRGVRNLWAVGKCLSADRLAQASARVVGSCWSMGEAAGRQATME
jgi:hypothetical protein